MNDFLNSLSEDEFTEFIQQRDLPLEKLGETGRASELAHFAPEADIDLREQHLQELSALMESEDDHLDSKDVMDEFKVFRDPTFNEFIEIVGSTYNPDMPLFA